MLLLPAPPTYPLLPAVVPSRIETARTAFEVDSVSQGDALDFLTSLPAGCADMILADLPYGTTACSWDEVIPFEPMWKAFRHVIKPRGAIVLTASQPFTSRLVCSNLGMFRYEWIWDKGLAGGFLDAMRKPMKLHENITVFSLATHEYTPQFEAGTPYKKSQQSKQKPDVWGKFERKPSVNESGKRFPKTIIRVPNAYQAAKIHPTQKPVPLFEYLIRTYTQPGDLVIDPTCGSGTTGIAARNCGRHFLLNDKYTEWVEVTKKRLAQPYTIPLPLGI